MSPRRAHNRPRRTREGPEPACVRTPLVRGWHTQEGKGELRRPAVEPSGRRGKYLQLDAREDQAARKGKWSPRGKGMTVLTSPGMRPGNKAMLVKTVKIQETGQHLILDKTVGSCVW